MATATLHSHSCQWRLLMYCGVAKGEAAGARNNHIPIFEGLGKLDVKGPTP